MYDGKSDKVIRISLGAAKYISTNKVKGYFISRVVYEFGLSVRTYHIDVA